MQTESFGILFLNYYQDCQGAKRTTEHRPEAFAVSTPGQVVYDQPCWIEIRPQGPLLQPMPLRFFISLMEARGSLTRMNQ